MEKPTEVANLPGKPSCDGSVWWLSKPRVISLVGYDSSDSDADDQTTNLRDATWLEKRPDDKEEKTPRSPPRHIGVNLNSWKTFEVPAASRRSSESRYSDRRLRPTERKRGGDGRRSPDRYSDPKRRRRSTSPEPQSTKPQWSPDWEFWRAERGQGLQTLTNGCKTDMHTYWRYVTMNLVSSRSLFIFEFNFKADIITGLKITIGNKSFAMNTEHWSISDDSRRTAPCPTDLKPPYMADYMAQKLIMFILENANEIPMILTSSVHKLWGTRFWRSMFYEGVLTGSQKCHFGYCQVDATTALVGRPELYCSQHALSMGFENRVLLYNPFVIAFAEHSTSSVISALNIDRVFGLRTGETTFNFVHTWTPLAMVSQCQTRKRTPLHGETYHQATSRKLKKFLQRSKGLLCKTHDFDYSPFTDLL